MLTARRPDIGFSRFFRTHNHLSQLITSKAANPGSLRPVLDTDGHVPAAWSGNITLERIRSMKAAELTALLKTYGLAARGNPIMQQRRLLEFISNGS